MPIAYIDMHLHSRFSRACSKSITLDTLERAAIRKGLNILSVSDFTHPIWSKEIKSELKEVDNTGLYHYKSKDVYFMISTEISLMYRQDGKGRRVHHLITAPNIEVSEQITDWLKTRGRVDYDGRPIFGFTSPELVENMMQISKEIMIIPCHALTPWFGILGSKSGFDSIEECFQDQTKHIYSIETGLSADPDMLWRISSLDKYTLTSNSDSHSANTIRLGREFNAIKMKEFSYKNIIKAIKTGKGFMFTCEVPPELGKYHWDGHRKCDIVCSPEESKKNNRICPKCKTPMTIGVEYRIEELADRKLGYKPKGKPGFKRLLPLSELLAAVYHTGVFTKKVQSESNKLMEEFGSELDVLLKADENKMRLMLQPKVVDILMKNREGKLKMKPGYDGVYGEIILEKNESITQSKLGKYIKK